MCMLVQACIDSCNSFCFHVGHRTVQGDFACLLSKVAWKHGGIRHANIACILKHAGGMQMETCNLHAFEDMQLACMLRHALCMHFVLLAIACLALQQASGPQFLPCCRLFAHSLGAPLTKNLSLKSHMQHTYSIPSST